MNKIVKRMYISISTILGILIMSCAFPFQTMQNVELSDISGQLRYNDISRQAFIGGSLLYNPDQMSSGHLAPGVHIAIRLGKVDKNETIPGQPEFLDKMDEAKYGYITINSIDSTYLTFSYTQYDAKHNFKTTSEHSLNLNGFTDINRDGIADLTYVAPVRKRHGMEKAVYLTFMSSQETLNTTMFAVLPEQYSRGVYPNGLIGINPDGRFIVTKYEHENSSIRSAVTGLVYGDYVMDYQTGTYQKVTRPGNYRSARAVDDSELTDISASEKTDLYFTVEEFDDLLRANDLYNALPYDITNRYSPEDFTNETLTHILNNILESYELILAVASEKDIGLTYSELEEVRNGIQYIELGELVKINRIFLAETYPGLCPELQTNSDDIVFILPLLHIVICGETEIENDDDTSRNVVSSYSTYTTQKNTLKSKYSKYLNIKTFSPDILFPQEDTGAKLSTKNEISFGIYGSLENNWGSSIKMNVSVVTYLQIEWAQVNLSKTFVNKSLLGNPITIANISAPTFWIGPVMIDITCPISFDVNLSITGKLGLTSTCFIGFAGLYGAEGRASANYGISWKKVLFIKLPVPYFNTSFGSDKISEFAFYAGPIDNTVTTLINGISPVSINHASVNLEVTPKLIFNPKVSAWKIIHVGLGVDVGLTGRFYVSALQNADQLLVQKKLPVTGTASLHLVSKLDVIAGIGFEINILGIKIKAGKSYSFNLSRSSEQLGSTIKMF